MRSDKERALVQITSDDRNELSVGSHVMYRGDCMINVKVINNGKCACIWADFHKIKIKMTIDTLCWDRTLLKCGCVPDITHHNK